RVDAIALACRRRAVGEDVALVRTAAGADDLGADHAVAGVADILEMAGGKRLGEARPAGAALELRAAVEQRQAAQPAGVGACALLGQEHPAERRLGAVLEQHVAFLLPEAGGEQSELLLGRRGEVELERGGVGHGAVLAALMGLTRSGACPFLARKWPVRFPACRRRSAPNGTRLRARTGHRRV